jgi:hypothetical protein
MKEWNTTADPARLLDEREKVRRRMLGVFCEW